MTDDRMIKKNPDLFSSEMQKKISAVAIDHVYQQGYAGQATTILCATILFFGLYGIHAGHAAWLLFWYALSLAVAFFRIICAYFYLRSSNPGEHVVFWKRLFIANALIGGIGWGIAGGVLFPIVTTEQQMLIIVLVVGIAAGSIPVLSAILYSSFAFLVPTLLPLMIQISWMCSDSTYHAINLAIAAYFFYLLAISLKTNQMFTDAIYLRFENEWLVKNLSRAKNQLENTNKKLELAATHDPLTGLANRNLFTEYFTLALQRAEKSKKLLTLMYIDLDNFKFVNDAYGHHAGDQLLIKFISFIQQAVPENGFIGRLGGDELVIIIEEVMNTETACQLAEKICHATNRDVVINNNKIHLSASIGVSIYPTDALTAEELLKLADRAMYYIKGHGRNSFYLASNLSSDDALKKSSAPGSHYIL